MEVDVRPKHEHQPIKTNLILFCKLIFCCYIRMRIEGESNIEGFDCVNVVVRMK